jgi:transcriptional regulator with XRE-family HTH domain
MAVDFDRIKELREKLKLSQQEAADLAGINSRQRWNDIESGRNPNMRVDTLEAIAKALGVKPADLLK